MAKYDRRILLPYLQNLYCLELSIQQQRQGLEQYRNALAHLEERLANDVEPKDAPPPSPAVPILFGCVSLILCCSCAIFSVMAAKEPRIWVAAIAVVLLALIFLGLFLRSLGKFNRRNQAYRAILKQRIPFEQRDKYHRWLEQRIIRVRERMNAAAAMMDEAVTLRRSLYDLNVIPVQYRAMPAAEYLYDYFVSTKADDLDTVISGYAVSLLYPEVPQDEPKNAARILNQRIRTAEQVTGDLSYRHYYKNFAQKIMEEETNPDMRDLYFKLVQADLKAAAFFARLAPMKEEEPAKQE